jgi:hypothetical protein
VKVIEIVRILKVFLFTALDQMTIHGAVVMDFFVHSAVWLDSYHNRLWKKKPEESQ